MLLFVWNLDFPVGLSVQIEHEALVAYLLQVGHILSNHDVQVSKNVGLQFEYSVDSLDEGEVVLSFEVVNHIIQDGEELTLLCIAQGLNQEPPVNRCEVEASVDVFAQVGSERLVEVQLQTE